jgi:rubrerythrin
MEMKLTAHEDRRLSASLQATLWRCRTCNSFISIHSAEPVSEPFCPVCGDVPVEFCGRFQSIFGLQFADA